MPGAKPKEKPKEGDSEVEEEQEPEVPEIPEEEEEEEREDAVPPVPPAAPPKVEVVREYQKEKGAPEWQTRIDRIEGDLKSELEQAEQRIVGRVEKALGEIQSRLPPSPQPSPEPPKESSTPKVRPFLTKTVRSSRSQ
jgi:hypothetical protein